jgi:menaquinone-9 beta-reductase
VARAASTTTSRPSSRARGRRHGPGYALVGDAGYFKDPITAHGISDTLRDAELLARAVIEGSETALMRYQEARDALSSELFEISDECAGFQWNEARIQKLHRQLSREMKRECEALLALGSLQPRRAA